MAKKRRIKNPVARVLNTFNKPATHKDKTKYNRKSNKGPKDLFYWLEFLHLISILMRVLFRGDKTGGAWWPVCPNVTQYCFEDNVQYKICEIVYSADTTAFREKWAEAEVLSTWDAICK